MHPRAYSSHLQSSALVGLVGLLVACAAERSSLEQENPAVESGGNSSSGAGGELVAESGAGGNLDGTGGEATPGNGGATVPPGSGGSDVTTGGLGSGGAIPSQGGSGNGGELGRGGGASGGTTSGSGGAASGGAITASGGATTASGGAVTGDGGASVSAGGASGGTTGVPNCASGEVWCYGECRDPIECYQMSGGRSSTGGSDSAGGEASSQGGFQGSSEYCGTGTVYDGVATWYILSAMPNCSYPMEEVTGNYAAINTAQYAASATCGACAELSSGGNSVVVQVVDQCPTCSHGSNQIDISQAAFQTLADLGVGVLDITWRYVECPDTIVSGNLEYAIKDGSSVYWSAIAFRNFPVPLTQVTVTNRLGDVKTPTRMDYNYWLDADGFGLGPYTVEVTNANGQTISFTLPALPDGTMTGAPVFRETTAQFAPCS